MKLIHSLPSRYLAASLVLTSSLAAAPSDPMLEFSPREARSLDWQVVDDGVMGGLSKGNLAVSKDGVLTFQGKLSLENNGGFSSVRTGKFEKDLSGAEGLVARVKGDGRTYQLRIYTNARYRGMRVSFKAKFSTENGEWTEVKVPFGDFVGSFRGRLLKDAKFDPSEVEGVGLLLADKQAGPFKLEVDWIRSYGGKGGQDVVSLAAADGRFGVLAKVLNKAGLVDTLKGEGPFTVFAPTDEAFGKLPEKTVAALLKSEGREKLQEVLKYHVLAGSVDLAGALKAGEAPTLQGAPVSVSFENGQVKVNEAALLNADIKASNGIIHVIDSVLLPPKPANDLAAVAKRAGNFKTLLAAVEAAGLTDALAGDKALTILAPTDDAFAALPEGTLTSLLKKENRDQLRSILTLHVIPGKVSAGDALNAGAAKSLSKGDLQFAINEGIFKVNEATILSTDIECDNGIIHVIDQVLLPAKGDTTSSLSPTERIEKAIDRGVPVFNDGDPGQCAKIYRDCMIEIAESKGTDARITEAMKKLVSRADQIENDTERAWMLRSGLDKLYAIFLNH